MQMYYGGTQTLTLPQTLPSSVTTSDNIRTEQRNARQDYSHKISQPFFCSPSRQSTVQDDVVKHDRHVTSGVVARVKSEDGNSQQQIPNVYNTSSINSPKPGYV